MSEAIRVQIVCDRRHQDGDAGPCPSCGARLEDVPARVTATLTGLDALVMDWARKKIAYDAAWDRWYQGGREMPAPADAYDAELKALEEAEAALRSHDQGGKE